MKETSVGKLRVLQTRLKKVGVNRIFDSHTHAFDKKDVLFRPRKATMASVSFSHYPIERNLRVANVAFSEFKKGYRQAVFGLPTHNTNIKVQNERILDWAIHDKRLVPLALVSPKMSFAEIEMLIRKGFSGLKPYPELYPRFRRKINVDLYLTENMLKVSERFGVPVILHSVPDASTSPSTQKIINAAIKYPKANIILAHMGRGRNSQKALILCNAIKNYKNIFVSTSVTTDPKVFEIALKSLGPRRVMFGTDFPWALLEISLKKIGKTYGSKKTPKRLQGWHYLSKKKYKWNLQGLYELSSNKKRKSINRLFVSELDALVGVLEQMISKGEISLDDVKTIFWGNANQLLKRRIN
jgi:predicted TIM-barrel fold metal-dependent hydrolase